MSDNIQKLFETKLTVVNVGVSDFADALRRQNVEVVEVDWRPPAAGDAEMADLLSKIGF